MARPVLIFTLAIGFAMTAAAQNKESRLPENTIDCKQFKKTSPQEWVEVETAVFDLGKITDINLTNQPVKPRSFKFGGIDLYSVLEEKCGAAGYLNRGKIDQAKGDYDSALAHFNQALLLDPNYAEAYDNRGEAYAGKGEYTRAIADYNEALRLDLKLESAAKHRTIAAEKLAKESGSETPAEPKAKLEEAVAVPEKESAPVGKESTSASLPEQTTKDQAIPITEHRIANPKNQSEIGPCRSAREPGCKMKRRNSATRAKSFYDNFVRMFHARGY
jgi:tetratricopeptide (TPR) repeat protein